MNVACPFFTSLNVKRPGMYLGDLCVRPSIISAASISAFFVRGGCVCVRSILRRVTPQVWRWSIVLGRDTIFGYTFSRRLRCVLVVGLRRSIDGCRVITIRRTVSGTTTARLNPWSAIPGVSIGSWFATVHGCRSIWNWVPGIHRRTFSYIFSRSAEPVNDSETWYHLGYCSPITHIRPFPFNASTKLCYRFRKYARNGHGFRRKSANNLSTRNNNRNRVNWPMCIRRPLFYSLKEVRLILERFEKGELGPRCYLRRGDNNGSSFHSSKTYVPPRFVKGGRVKNRRRSSGRQPTRAALDVFHAYHHLSASSDWR